MKTKIKESSWEERFDKEFYERRDNFLVEGHWVFLTMCHSDDTIAGFTQFKDFFSKCIHQDLKAQLEQVEEIIDKENQYLIDNDCPFEIAYLVIKKIKSKLKAKINNLGETK